MKQIFKNSNQIKHLVKKIEKEWDEPWDMDVSRPWKGLPTVNILRYELHKELLMQGGATPEQLIDANEILYYYLNTEVSRDMWQYSFADCLISLLTDFDEPFVPTNARERLIRGNILTGLEQKCVAVLMSDLARIRKAKVHALAPLASMGKNHSVRQSQRAKKPRGPLTELITWLVHQHPEQTAKELWPHLYSALEEEQRQPKEFAYLDRWRYEYTFNNTRKTISFGRFATIIATLKSR